MQVSKPLSIPLTGEEVLAVFQDWHRFNREFDRENTPMWLLSFDSSVSDWKSSCGLRGRRRLGRYLNRAFGIKAGETAWVGVLTDENVLRNVCNFICKHGARSAANVHSCSTDGSSVNADTFFELRSMLFELEVPVEAARPSTELEPMLNDHWDAFATAIAKLAPGALPVLSSRFGDANPITILVALFMTCLVFYSLYRASASAEGSLMFTVFLFIILFRFAKARVKSTLYSEGIETFGDLTRIVAQQKSRNSRTMEMP